MQLGNILSTAAEPVVGRVVEFRVLGTDQSGRQVSARAEALLTFVDEERREETKRFAREYLEAHDFKGSERGVPFDVLSDEEIRCFIFAALRDKEMPDRQFCPNTDYGRFRRALIVEQVRWLKLQYDKFVEDEYPELATKKQQEELLEQAVGK